MDENKTLKALQLEPDASQDILFIFPAPEEMESRSDRLAILQEAGRVLTEEGMLVAPDLLTIDLADLDEEDEYIPMVDEILGILGRGDLDADDLSRMN